MTGKDSDPREIVVYSSNDSNFIDNGDHTYTVYFDNTFDDLDTDKILVDTSYNAEVKMEIESSPGNHSRFFSYDEGDVKSYTPIYSTNSDYQLVVDDYGVDYAIITIDSTLNGTTSEITKININGKDYLESDFISQENNDVTIQVDNISPNIEYDVAVTYTTSTGTSDVVLDFSIDNIATNSNYEVKEMTALSNYSVSIKIQELETTVSEVVSIEMNGVTYLKEDAATDPNLNWDHSGLVHSITIDGLEEDTEYGNVKVSYIVKPSKPDVIITTPAYIKGTISDFSYNLSAPVENTILIEIEEKKVIDTEINSFTINGVDYTKDSDNVSWMFDGTKYTIEITELQSNTLYTVESIGYVNSPKGISEKYDVIDTTASSIRTIDFDLGELGDYSFSMESDSESITIEINEITSVDSIITGITVNGEFYTESSDNVTWVFNSGSGADDSDTYSINIDGLEPGFTYTLESITHTTNSDWTNVITTSISNQSIDTEFSLASKDSYIFNAIATGNDSIEIEIEELEEIDSIITGITVNGEFYIESSDNVDWNFESNKQIIKISGLKFETTYTLESITFTTNREGTSLQTVLISNVSVSTGKLEEVDISDFGFSLESTKDSITVVINENNPIDNEVTEITVNGVAYTKDSDDVTWVFNSGRGTDNDTYTIKISELNSNTEYKVDSITYTTDFDDNKEDIIEVADVSIKTEFISASEDDYKITSTSTIDSITIIIEEKIPVDSVITSITVDNEKYTEESENVSWYFEDGVYTITISELDSNTEYVINSIEFTNNVEGEENEIKPDPSEGIIKTDIVSSSGSISASAIVGISIASVIGVFAIFGGITFYIGKKKT